MNRRRCRCLLASLGLAASLGLTVVAAEPEISDRAAARYRELLERNPSEAPILDRLWKWHVDRGTTAGLLRSLETASGVNAALLHGQFLRRAGRAADAKAAFERAAAADEKNPEPWFALADLATAASDHPSAVRALEAALMRLPEEDGRRADTLMKLGTARSAAGNGAGAAEAWEQAAALDPGNLTLRSDLAKTFEQAGQLDRAVAALEAVVERAAPAERLTALREIARLQQQRDDFDGARSALQRALALTGRSHWMRPELQQTLIRLHQRAGREAELVDAWEREAAAAPRDAARLWRLGELFGELGDADREATSLEQVIELTPRDRDARQRLARLLTDRGEWEKAASQLDALLRDATRPPLDITLARAELDVLLGRAAAGAERVQRFLAESGRDDSVRSAVLAFLRRNRFDAEAEALLRADRDRQPAADEPVLALVEFEFAQRKPAAARAELERWTAARTGEAPPARAVRLERAAEVLKTNGFSTEAAASLAEAVAVDPASKGSRRLALADLLAQNGDAEGARRVVEAAYLAAETEAERNEADDKLFQLLQSLGSQLPPVAPAPGRPSGSVARDNPVVRDFLRELDQKVRQPGTDSAAVLRLARFLVRAGAPEAAIEAAQRIIRLRPDNVPAREFLVRMAAETGRRHLAIDQLGALARLDPEHARKHRRALAFARIDDRDFDDGLAILRELEAAQPGAAEPMIDFANGLQRAERWYDAVVAWERAQAVAAPRLRAEIRPQFIAALEKTGNRTRAAELLLGALDDEADPARRLEGFREVVQYAATAGLLAWLEERAEARLRGAPQDYYALSALAELRKAQRRDADAYALLQRAVLSAPQPAAALQNLVQLAEERGDFTGALRNQRRLLQLAAQNTPENLERVAALEETALDYDAAAATWERIAARFPRDAAILARAAEFFRRNGETGRERRVLGQLVALGGTEPPRLLHFARLQLADGRIADARATLEGILQVTEARSADEPVLLPVEVEDPKSASFPRSRLFPAPGGKPASPARTVTAAPAPGSDARARLDAIGELARLALAERAKQPAVLEAWIARWNASAVAAPSDALAAWFHAGRADLVLTWLAPRIESPGAHREELGRGFVGVALAGNQTARLGAWVNAPPDREGLAERRIWLVDGLETFLRGGAGRPVPAGIVQALFPPPFRARAALWGDTVARAFLTHQHYREAIEIASQALAQTTTNRAAYGLEIARWYLLLGEADNAREILRFALDGRNSAESLEAPWFEALRYEFFLLPATARPAFVQQQIARGAEGGPVQGALAAVWLEALAGRMEAARAALDRWLALRPGAARETEFSASNGMLGRDASWTARHLAAVIATGVKLELLPAPDLAAHLWKRTLENQIFLADDDDRGRDLLRELRQRYRPLEWSLATPAQAEILVSDYLASSPPLEEVSGLATALATRQNHALAQRLREHLYRAERGSAEHWRGILTAQRAAGDFAALRETLEAQLKRTSPAPASVGQREILVQLIDLEEKLGNFKAARERIQTYLLTAARESYFRQRLAQNFERSGMLDEAAAAYRSVLERENDFPIAAQNLAQLEERRGNPAEVVRLLENLARRGTSVPVDVSVRLVRVLIESGKGERAREFALGLLHAGQFAYLPRVAEAFAAKEEKPFAIELLQNAAQKCREPQARFTLSQTLLEQYLSPAVDTRAYTRELRRLRVITEAEPRLLPGAYNLRLALAKKHGTEEGLTRELRAEWRGGAGPALAGERLIDLLAAPERREETSAVLREYLARPDAFSASPEPAGQPLFSLHERLQKAGLPELSVGILDALSRRFPQSDLLVTARAVALHRAGRTPEAIGALDDASLRWLANPSVLRPVALARVSCGDRAGAIRDLDLAAKLDARSEFPVYAFESARLRLEDKDFAGARRALRIAYRCPQARDLGPLVDLLAAEPGDALEEAAGRIAGDFQLRAELRSPLAAALALRLFKLERFAAARRVIATRPSILVEPLGLLGPLRESAVGDEDFVATERLFRDAISQARGPHERLLRDAALFMVAWADFASNQGRTDEALTRLTQGRTWDPLVWDATKRLAELRAARGEKALARAALNEFLAHAEIASGDREKARAMLRAL